MLIGINSCCDTTMALLSEPRIDTGFSGDALDQALTIAWFVSDIAVDAFGMLFWSALALLFARLFG